MFFVVQATPINATMRLSRVASRRMNQLEPLVGVVRSCQVASESFDVFNRLAAALARSQDHRVLCGVFSFGADRTPHDSKHSNLGGVEEKRDTVCRKARGQFPNNPCGWSYHEAEGHTVINP